MGGQEVWREDDSSWMKKSEWKKRVEMVMEKDKEGEKEKKLMTLYIPLFCIIPALNQKQQQQQQRETQKPN